PLNLQLQLLRALEEKSLRPKGYNQDIPFNVRIISSSHQPLAQALLERRFRQDLYYRLNVIELTLPPLRNRPEDISLLAEYYLRSEEHTSELQSRFDLVCRLLLEKKK